MSDGRPLPSSRKPDDVDANEQTFQDELMAVMKRHAHAMSYGELAYLTIMHADACMAANGIERRVEPLDDDSPVTEADQQIIIEDPVDEYDQRRIPLFADLGDRDYHGVADRV
jgi:hypothetical protein